MIEAAYDGSLECFFDLLDRACRDGAPLRVRRACSGQGKTGQPELFAGAALPAPDPALPRRYNSLGAIRAPVLSRPSAAEELAALSLRAYGHVLYGWMSELPIEAELIRYALGVIAAGRSGGNRASPEAREAAEWAAADRGDPAAERVMAASYRVGREIHRLMGLLRFSPAGGVFPEGCTDRRNAAGVLIARCTPDHFVLPALAGHFRLRFGSLSWAVVDEKRRLALCGGGEVRLVSAEAYGAVPAGKDPWEALWRVYHRSVNNEGRNKPRVQRRFMPERYWKYLPELIAEDPVRG
jgi:probable DNA metabolism protein